MTSIATIADASTIADDWRGWAFVAAVLVIGFAVLVVIAVRYDLGNVPVMGDELSTLDRLDRIGDQCRRTGHYYQLNDTHTTYHCANTGCTDTRRRDGGAA